jgi:hypothetical protein
VKHATIVVAALVLVFGVQALGRADAPRAVQKWEYRLVGVVPGTSDAARFFGSPPAESLVTAQSRLVEQVKSLGYEVVEMGEFRKFLTDAGMAGWDVTSMGENAWLLKRPLP